MKKVKITVLKTTLDKELAKEYGADGLTACPMLKEGQVFYADYAKPEGFCDEAWKAIYQYALSLIHILPLTINFTEVSCSMPIGPLAWSF